ncbi:MAG: hypothetical protein K0S07_58 [Chlamydiales bacterium]|jgi:ribosomal protein RSM22 (predicted rRNA methylase)|nr:hypothetical protein [Chlamydiales bacterium]
MSHFLSALEQIIQEKLQRFPQSELKKSFELLSKAYREGFGSSALFQKDSFLYSYLAARAPATFAVMHTVLEQIEAIHQTPIQSVIDVGAGLGAATFAALDLFPSIQSLTLVEQSEKALSIAESLLNPVYSAGLTISRQDMCEKKDAQADLVLFSYSIGEVKPAKLPEILKNALLAANQFLVITEPGTPRGFQTLLQCRDLLLSLNASIVAPCPHASACPMPKDRWCHFRKRLPRNFLQRIVKEASLPWEDEKYCYLIVRPKPFADQHPFRVLKEVEKHTGHLYLELCSPEGTLDRALLSKKHASYKKAKKVDWGDPFMFVEEGQEEGL